MSSYTKSTWIDRNIERPKTFTQTTNLDGSITFTDAPGTVYASGTAVTAARMNNIESGVEVAFNKSTIHDRELANIEAALDIDNRAIQNSGKFYDLFDGTNNYSAGQLDTTITALSGAHSAGVATITVDSTTGFVVGQEITLQDDTNREDKIIQSINVGANQITFTANLASNFKDDSSVYRSNVLISGSKMNFGGWTSIVEHDHSIPVQVINDVYNPSEKGGRKLIRMSNGWLIASAINVSTDYRFYKSMDNGATWSLLGIFPYVVACCAITSIGNNIYMFDAYTSITCRKFDATQASGGDITALGSYTQKTIASGFSSSSNYVSCALDSSNNMHVCWHDKTATYPNSYNIRYSTSTDAGVTWAGATSITTNNSTGQDNLCPNIIIRSDKPIIVWAFAKPAATASYIIKSIRYTTSWQTAVNVYDGGTYLNESPSAVTSPDGNLHVSWHGKDVTDNTYSNLRYNKSTDGGATWGTASKLTSGNTYDQSTSSITADSTNKIYIIWGGQVNSSYYQVRKIIYNGSWGSVVDLTTGNSNKADLTTCSNYIYFTDPITIYKSTQDVQMMYRGILQATGQAALTSNIARYNIIPPTGTSAEIVSWIQHERATPDTDFVVTAYESIVDTSANESYTAMTKTTSNLSASAAEEQFLMTPSSAQEKVTLKVIMTRATTSINKAITKLLGAVG